MHLPYLWKRLEQTHGGDTDDFPTIVPILVGSNDRTEEKIYGNILLPYLKDPENAFIISSDFCHWGLRFKYTKYFSLAAARDRAEEERRMAEEEQTRAEDGLDTESEEDNQINGNGDIKKGSKTERNGKTKGEEKDEKEPEPILVSHQTFPRGKGDMELHESIKILDEQAMAAVETGIHDNFLKNLRQTGNTVCGRHPIGVMMAAMEALNKENPEGPQAKFKLVNYDRSSKAAVGSDSSVSYASFYAVV